MKANMIKKDNKYWSNYISIWNNNKLPKIRKGPYLHISLILGSALYIGTLLYIAVLLLQKIFHVG